MMPPQTPVTSNTERQLQSAADHIRNLSRQTSDAAIEIGGLLLEAKKLIPHGSFAKWVQSMCGFTLRTAQTYMRVAAFASGKNENVSLLTLRALYLLSAKRTPEEVVTWAVREIDAGHVPAEHEIEAALRSARAEVCTDLAAEEDNAARQSAGALARQLIERVGPSFARALLSGHWGRIGEELNQQLRPASDDPSHNDPTPLQPAHFFELELCRPETAAPDGPRDEHVACSNRVKDPLSLASETPAGLPARVAEGAASVVPRNGDGIPEFLRRAPSGTHH